MNNLRSKLSNLKNACHIFRHYLRWPYPMYKPSQFDSFNHEHTCLASKLTNIELSDICPLAKAGQPFEVARRILAKSANTSAVSTMKLTLNMVISKSTSG